MLFAKFIGWGNVLECNLACDILSSEDSLLVPFDKSADVGRSCRHCALRGRRGEALLRPVGGEARMEVSHCYQLHGSIRLMAAS